MVKLSATVITLNEEGNLSKCLSSLKGFIDEVIVVDSGSVDKTLAIAKEFGSKIYERKFDNFANQKNFAMEKATGEWILSVDADEVISKGLASEILDAVKTQVFVGYLIPRRNFILGAEIKHSRWSPDKHIWLWEKEFGKWVGGVHEEVEVNGRIGELKNPKIHYQDKTIREFMEGNNFYSMILAKDMYKNHIRFSVSRFIWDPFFEFSVRYIYKLGFLDGWRGFVLAVLMARYKMQVWLNLLSLQK